MLRGSWSEVFVFLVLLIALAATPALGHAELESATPDEGENLGQAPPEVRLDFGEPVEAAFSPIEVYDSEGNRVDEDDGRTDPDDASVVVANLREGLPAGTYRVEWTVTSADGDPVSGEYSFDVRGSSQEEEPGGEDASGPGGGESAETGGSGSTVLYAGLAVGVIALFLGLFSLRGRGR